MRPRTFYLFDIKKKAILISLMGMVCYFIISCKHEGPSGAEVPSTVQDSVLAIIDEVAVGDQPRTVLKSQLLRAFRLHGLIQNDSVKKLVLDSVARNSLRYRNDELARMSAEHLQDIAVAGSDTLGIAKAHWYLGLYYLRKDQIDSAANKFYYAERFYRLSGDFINAGRSVLNLAILQKNQKDYIGSEQSTVRALEFLEGVEGEQRRIASAYNNLGIIAKDTEKYDLAIEYHNQALEYRQQIGNPALEASSFNNLGIVYTNMGQYEKAIETFNEGLDNDSLFFQRPITYAKLLDNKAYAQLLGGKEQGYPEAFMIPFRLRDSISDKSGKVQSYLRLSEYYLMIDSISKSHTYAKDALALAQEIGYQRGEQESLQLLAKNSEPAIALNYNNRFIAINDSLQKAERSFQDRFARLRFQTDVLEDERNRVIQTNKQLQLVLLSMIAFALLGYIFIQRRANRKELHYQADQQKANEEIYSLMLSQKVKLEEGKQIEKQRISEELHDGILSKLFGARLSLDSLNAKVDDKSVGIRQSYIQEIKNIESEIRSISHELNASAFNSEVIYVDAIEKLLRDQCTIHNIEFELNSDHMIEWEKMSNDKKVHLYRIIQEALQNIMKHAKADEISVRFAQLVNGVRLTIEDDGIGMNTSKVKRGIGLKNIKSRVKQIEGNLRIQSEEGKGTQITVDFIA
ncbi:sensor histidine kinase [Gilvibacter sediminis]|uniref:ATP-binding protein n=1 Tax=Gilvibacter sediminis TaxID=379071 RepID=UPI002350D057|nr:sensor histidine kinase [Gilvibacter sediminis]MDC7998738.1 sensor histidine kinase [Gilvibacter sediminis]